MSGWAVAGVVVAGLAGLAALFLASWLRLDLRLDGEMGRVRLRWTGLAVSLDAYARAFEVRLLGWRVARRPLGVGREPHEREGRRARKPRRPRGGKRRRPRRVRRKSAAGAWRFYRRQLGFLVRRVRLDRCEGRLRIATPDPAVTGVLYGVASSVTMPLAARWPQAALAVEPDFVGTVPGGWLALALRVRLATLAWLALRIMGYERSHARRSRTGANGKEGSEHGTEPVARVDRGEGPRDGQDRDDRG